MTLLHKIKYRLRYLVMDIRTFTGGGDRLLRNRSGARILIYHGIDAVGSTEYNTRFISESVLERQLVYFKQHFNVVSLEDYYKGNSDPARLTITLTFDDGYQNNFTRALPILEKHAVPATFFVTGITALQGDFLWMDWLDLATGQLPDTIMCHGQVFRKNRKNKFIHMGSKQVLQDFFRGVSHAETQACIRELSGRYGIDMMAFLPDYYRTMCVEELQKAARSPFITIGSHSMTHADLNRISPEEARYELRKSKEFLEQMLQIPVTAFAFPFGAYSKGAIDAALSAGYTKILLADYTDEESREIPELRCRITMNPFISFNNQIHALLNNRY